MSLDQIVYRGVDEFGQPAEWGTLRIMAGDVDVTNVAGVPTQTGGWQLIEPFGYGPADFRFPNIMPWEFPDYPWLEPGTQIRIEHLDATGALVPVQWPGASEPAPYLWRGFIAKQHPTLDGFEVRCDGYFAGRLAAKKHFPRLWNLTKSIATWIYDELNGAGIQSEPMFGDGIVVDEIDPRDIQGTSLSYVEELLSRTLQADGTQLTLVPSGETLEQVWKNLGPVHFSAFNAASGHILDVERDLLEEFTTIYGEGREPATDDDPEVLVWVNRKDPGLKQGPPPPFPGTLSPGDSSEWVNTLQRKLAGTGYLNRRDTVGGFNEATEDAVRELQRDSGLSVTGIVNEATWEAAFDIADSGELDLRQ